jgi:hypothetical protein
MRLSRASGRYLVGVVIALLVAGCGEAPPQAVTGTTPLATGPRETTTPPPPLATTIDHDDTYIIGKDIQAGKWHTSGPRRKNIFSNGSVVQVLNECHWQLGWPKSAAGRRDRARIAEGDVTGPQDVDVNVVGAEFQTNGCQAWHIAEKP